MLVSDTERTIFVHNPKCGGTTVRQALMPFETMGNRFSCYEEFNNHKVDMEHVPLRVLQYYFPQTFDKFENYFTFMIVRDPYRRAISAFNQKKKKYYRRYKSNWLYRRMVYPARLNRFFTNMTPSDVYGWHTGWQHFQRQSDFAFLDGEKKVDLILKLEDWPRCIDLIDQAGHHKLSDALRAAPIAKAKRLKQDPLELLSSESIERINQLYQADFDNFGYLQLF
jgi:hypothetical protein